MFPQQTPLNVPETNLHPLTPTEISHTTSQSNTAIRLLLKRTADSDEIAHQHCLASNSPVNTETPATPETFDTIATTSTQLHLQHLKHSIQP